MRSASIRAGEGLLPQCGAKAASGGVVKMDQLTMLGTHRMRHEQQVRRTEDLTAKHEEREQPSGMLDAALSCP